MTRRDALSLSTMAAVAPLALTSAPLFAAEGKGSGSVAPGKHVMAPLPFDPKKLKGLSERLITSHHENNYGGAVISPWFYCAAQKANAPV